MPSNIVPIKNAKNKTGFQGVCRQNTLTDPWRSEIIANSRLIILGKFESAIDAGKMYGKYAIIVHRNISIIMVVLTKSHYYSP
jgi:hypothetical protein